MRPIYPSGNTQSEYYIHVPFSYYIDDSVDSSDDPAYNAHVAEVRRTTTRMSSIKLVLSESDGHTRVKSLKIHEDCPAEDIETPAGQVVQESDSWHTVWEQRTERNEPGITMSYWRVPRIGLERDIRALSGIEEDSDEYVAHVDRIQHERIKLETLDRHGVPVVAEDYVRTHYGSASKNPHQFIARKEAEEVLATIDELEQTIASVIALSPQ